MSCATRLGAGEPGRTGTATPPGSDGSGKISDNLSGYATFETLEDFLRKNHLGGKNEELLPTLIVSATNAAKASRWFHEQASLFQCYAWLFRTKTIAVVSTSVLSDGMSDDTTDRVTSRILESKAKPW